MRERIEIAELVIQVKRGDDVSIPLTDFSITITGYDFAGSIYKQSDDAVVGTLTVDKTDLAAGNVTFSIPAATTLTMTEAKYYSYIYWTDTAGLVKTILHVIYEMV